MKKLKVAFLDFDPNSGLGETLKSILQVCPSPAIQVSQQSIPSHEPNPQQTISKFLQGFKGELIFLILPSARLEEARFFLRAWQKGEVQTPVMGIVEGAGPNEPMELLQMGMLDFMTPPLKAEDVLPRIWRILEKKTSDEILIQKLKQRSG